MRDAFFVIYENHPEWPERYVVREMFVDEEGRVHLKPVPRAITTTLGAARLTIPQHLKKLVLPDDERHVREVWW